MAEYKVKSGKVHRRENGVMVIYRPGDVLEASPYEVRGYRDLLQRLDGEDDPEQEKLVLEQPVSFTIQHRGGGKYNVLGVDGKPVNTRLLTRKEAEDIARGRTIGDTDTVEEEQNPEDKENQKDDPAAKSVGTGNRVSARRRTKSKASRP